MSIAADHADITDLSRPLTVACSCGCGRKADIFVGWERRANRRDGWYAHECCEPMMAVIMVQTTEGF